jgi:membrane-associated protease RseP (regulator of RpoE activity)
MNSLDFLIEFLLNPWTIISLIFWGVVSILVLLLRNKKKSYTLFFPLLILFRTKRLNRIITKIGKKYPKTWRVFWTIGIFISFGFTVFGFWFFFTNLISLIVNPTIQNAVAPLIPGVTIDLPIFAYLFLPLLFVITTHELAHGVAATADNVEIESTGVLGAGIFWIIGFGAFVEIDEKKLHSKKYSRGTRFRISAAGTYINAITTGVAFLFILITPFLISLSYSQVPQVYNVMKVQEGGYNYGNITAGDKIIAIRGTDDPTQSYTYLDYYDGPSLEDVLNTYTVGDNLTLKTHTNGGGYKEKNITLGPKIPLRYTYINISAIRINYNYTTNEEVNITITKINGIDINKSAGITFWSFRTKYTLDNITLSATNGRTYTYKIKDGEPYVGVTSVVTYMYKNDFGKILTNFFPEFISREIFWLFLIAFSVTLFNMLPLPIFDGDRMVKELVHWVVGEKYEEKGEKEERFIYDSESDELELSEYRVEKINYVKFTWGENQQKKENKITLGEDNYKLIDKIGDGFKSTISLDLHADSKIKEGAEISVSYTYWKDTKTQLKKNIVNGIRIITLVIVGLNFLISIMKFGLNPLGFL